MNQQPNPFYMIDPIELMYAQKCYEAGSPRHYHTFEHAENVMRLAQRHPFYIDTVPRVRLMAQKAILWHDAYYVAGEDQNEEKSCELSYAFINHDEDMIAITKAIMATKHKYEPWTIIGSAVVTTQLAQLVADADLCCCVVVPYVFRDNSAKIKLEFTSKSSTVGSSISPNSFDEGRKQWARGLLDWDRFFWEETWNNRYSDQIRENLRTLI